MEIVRIEPQDYPAIVSLVAAITAADVEPFFSEDDIAAQDNPFDQLMAQSIEATFDESQFVALKICHQGKLVGFGAIRDGNYLTHLFVQSTNQGAGLGKKLLNTLISSSTSSEITLRSSANAVSFYQDNDFVITGDKAREQGIPFVPMALVR